MSDPGDNKNFLAHVDKAMQETCILFPNRGEVDPGNRLVVSLTTYPGRMEKIRYTLYSLVDQTCPAGEIVLWLTEEEFPGGEASIGDAARADLEAFRPYGVTVRWCRNHRAYNKLVPALREYPDRVIVTADDDIYYPPDMLEILCRAHLRDPCSIIAHRAHWVGLTGQGELEPYNCWQKDVAREEPGFRLFLTGAGGVLYPPGALHRDVLRMDLALQMSPMNDDIWFWAMAVRNRCRIRVPRDCRNALRYVDPGQQEKGLWQTNIRENDRQIRNVLRRFPEVKELLAEEASRERERCLLEELRVKQGMELSLLFHGLKRKKRIALLRGETDWRRWFSLLGCLVREYLVVLVIRDTPGSNMPSLALECIRDAGFTRFRTDLWRTYVGVVCRGKMFFQGFHEDEEPTDYVYESMDKRLSLSATSRSWRRGDAGLVFLDGQQLAVNLRGVNLVVYDIGRGQLVDSVGFDSHDAGQVHFVHLQQQGKDGIA